MQRRRRIAQGSEVRNVEQRNAPRRHSIADRRSAQRVLDRKGLEPDHADAEGRRGSTHAPRRGKRSISANVSAVA